MTKNRTDLQSWSHRPCRHYEVCGEEILVDDAEPEDVEVLCDSCLIEEQDAKLEVLRARLEDHEQMTKRLMRGEPHLRKVILGMWEKVDKEVSEMKPSDIVLRPPIPLIGTMGRAEAELAAGYLVLTMREMGDTFGPVGIQDVGRVAIDVTKKANALEKVDALEKEYPDVLWMTIPPSLCSPDFRDLVTRGFAELTEPEREWESPLQFTQRGLEKLRKWYQPREAIKYEVGAKELGLSSYEEAAT